MSKTSKVFLMFAILGPLCAMLTLFLGLLMAAAFGFDSARGSGLVPQSPSALLQNIGRNAGKEILPLLLIFFIGGGLQAAFSGVVSAWWLKRKKALPLYVPLAAGLLSFLAFMILIQGRYWYIKMIENPHSDFVLSDFNNPLLFLVLHVALVLWPWLLLRQSGLIHNDPHHS